jgi:N-methylhydantoinase A/oxoprolinase/acetone carboxylase beta subunit
VSYRVELRVPSEKVEFAERETGGKAVPTRSVELRHFGDGPLEAAEYERDALPAGARIVGPAVIREGLATTLVVPGQAAEVGRLGELRIEAA